MLFGLVNTKRWGRREYLHLSVLFGVIALSVFLYLIRRDLGSLINYRKYGYLGVFLTTFLSSASIVLPLPGALAVILGGSFLNPFVVALIAGVAEPLGEMTGYLAGYGSRDLLRNRRGYQQVEDWMSKHGGLTIFVFSLIPNPFFDVMGAAAGALRYPVWKFLLFCWMGKTIKSLGFAILGSMGIGWVIRLLHPWSEEPFDDI